MKTAKYCGHCGAKLPEGARYCGMCRAEVSVQGESEAPKAANLPLRGAEPSVFTNTYPVDDEIEIGKSHTKLLWVLGGLLVFGGFGIWFLSYATVSIVMAIVGVVTLLFVVGGIIAIITMLSNHAPGLRFDSQGFDCAATKLGIGRIAWTEVEGYCIVEMFGQKFLSIRLKDPDAFLARLSPIQRTLAHANMTEELGGGPIAIASNALAIDFNSLVSLFDHYLHRYAQDVEAGQNLEYAMNSQADECVPGFSSNDDLKPELTGGPGTQMDAIRQELKPWRNAERKVQVSAEELVRKEQERKPIGVSTHASIWMQLIGALLLTALFASVLSFLNKTINPELYDYCGYIIVQESYPMPLLRCLNSLINENGPLQWAKVYCFFVVVVFIFCKLCTFERQHGVRKIEQANRAPVSQGVMILALVVLVMWGMSAFIQKWQEARIPAVNRKLRARATHNIGEMKTIQLKPGNATMDLMWCPAGAFMMGSPKAESGHENDETRHRVTLTEGFWMAKTEVTQEQWLSVMGDNPSNHKGNNLPVENVSWADCQEFCKKVGNGLTLPTEAEWEYACRAETTGTYGGTGDLESMGWYSENSRIEPHPVGQKLPNKWGLYDMHGNVSEWCMDWYGAYPHGAVTDPTGMVSGDEHVFRGGGYTSGSQACRSAHRHGVWDVGFRPVTRQD